MSALLRASPVVHNAGVLPPINVPAGFNLGEMLFTCRTLAELKRELDAQSAAGVSALTLHVVAHTDPHAAELSLLLQRAHAPLADSVTVADILEAGVERNITIGIVMVGK